MTDKDRSALLRMAGNIASGLVVNLRTRTIAERDALAFGTAEMAITIALAIFYDERLKVTEGEKP